ncbi:unnamed protein product [Prorocentrum cordatum]|uniref:Uncharacterized protein n=1 Tax=Prorocentrum cordatum TaxID=2364126 RepID=A0ABN9XB69_9DINO|nr:unnamed protein product [Polarella glacialis]
MQKHCTTCPASAMRVMAEVLRQARVLWPIEESDSAVSTTVIVRIEAIKDANLDDLVTMPGGSVWVLQKNSTQDGQVKKISLESEIDWSVNRMLHFKAHSTAQRAFQEAALTDASPTSRRSALRRPSGAGKKMSLPDVFEEQNTTPAQACFSCPFGRLQGMVRAARGGRSPRGAPR